MAATKKTVTTAAETKVEAAKVEAPKATVKAEAPKATVKAAVKKEEPAKKETAKKETAKKAPAKKETAKKAPAKTAAAKKVEKKVEVEVQFAGKTYTQEDLVKIAQDVWQYDLQQKVEDLKEVKLYVKPEESLVYYVLNGIDGSFAI